MLSFLALAAAVAAAPAPTHPGEEAVAPYVESNANAGAVPFSDPGLWRAFHEQAGVDRIVEDFVDRNVADPVIGGIFANLNLVRLRRTLKEQFCYILGGGCAYSGRDMKSAHKDLGIQAKDMNILVVNLQKAMSKEGVAFAAQNRLLSRLAPMRRDVVTR